MKSYITNIIMGLFVLMIFGVAGCGSRGTNATNAVPTASAGKVQNVAIGVSVTLDGGGSNDANKDLLTYRWILASKPYGSSASLSSAVSAKPTFTPDIAGMYVFSLVVNDGTVSSAANAVIVNASVANVAPVANAGTDRSVVAGTLVTLDGSGSSDMNHDLLLFRWLLVSRPDGSTAVVLNPTVAKTTFTPDVAGAYVFNLVANDGKEYSTVAVTITASVANAVPMAHAGANQSVTAGALVTLDGSGSTDINNDMLTYRWAFTSRPDGSSSELANPTTAHPVFTAYDPGTYVVQLVVNDGYVDSASATVTIIASLPETVVALETTFGIIKITLHESAAPLSCKNFMDYVNSGFYNNTIFHRVIPGFMIKGGGVTGDLTQKPTRSPIKNEASNGLPNLRGTVAMARTSEVDSATSQFFINVLDNNFLNFVDATTQGYGYAVFGNVVDGMDVVDKIAAVTTATSNGMSDVPVEQVVIKLVSVIQ